MEFRYRYRDQDCTIHIEQGKNDEHTARIGQQVISVRVERHDDGEIALVINGRRIAAE